MNEATERIARATVVVVGALVAAAVAWILFVAVPADLADLLGVVLVVAVTLFGVRLAGRIAAAKFPGYNVAEVAVEGPITRDGGRPGPLPRRATGPGADEIVAQIEAADEDDHAEALLVKLNTPGGQVVPSDDIRRAAMAFDGPTIAYATDVCASGGYWIASGCDELWARDATLVGSIGVIGSSVNVSDLAEGLGISYERFAAGKYKDAGIALKEISDDERAYLQGLIDDFYENFVERVAAGRDMDPEAIRRTEARVYLGENAVNVGLVDELGTREDVTERAEALLGEAVTVREFGPERGLMARLRGGAESVAYAFGAGLTERVTPDEGFDLRL
ncbi:signal peptide peptidase SppA [Halegenticoccus tardaugens]|uniref:signal peptide peptidase SppA n=1 Tax=Halegenticoccus tardaugens TaxID=2071624 RepID=UPI00100C1C06|nr:signal peptide peptidase SppA [Halegenticoccus tardaugens]